jgi:hypothetical protein
MMKTVVLVVTTIMVSFIFQNAYAQYDAQKKFEVGAEFSVLGINDPRGLSDLFPRTELGVGGRLIYNVTRHFALETEVDFFPRDYRKVRSNFTGGRMSEGLFGLKSGWRRNKFGIFGKVRPGFESSSRAELARFPNGNGPDRQNPFGFADMRATQFALDVGGVFELYPSRRTIVRFDLGDTIVRYPGIPFTQIPQGNTVVETLYQNKFQFSVGFGFRF